MSMAGKFILGSSSALKKIAPSSSLRNLETAKNTPKIGITRQTSRFLELSSKDAEFSSVT